MTDFRSGHFFSKILRDQDGCQSKCAENGCLMRHISCPRCQCPFCVLPWEGKGRPIKEASLAFCLRYKKLIAGKFLLCFVLCRDMFSVTALLQTPAICGVESSSKWDSEVSFVSLRKPVFYSQHTGIAVLSFSELRLANLSIAPCISALHRHHCF